MMLEFSDLRSLACLATLGLLLMSMLLVLVRLWLGPTAADRVVALDLFGVLVVAMLVVLAIFRAESADLDVAIAYSLVAFLGTVALARFIQRRQGRRHMGTEEGNHE